MPLRVHRRHSGLVSSHFVLSRVSGGHGERPSKSRGEGHGHTCLALHVRHPARDRGLVPARGLNAVRLSSTLECRLATIIGPWDGTLGRWVWDWEGYILRGGDSGQEDEIACILIETSKEAVYRAAFVCQKLEFGRYLHVAGSKLREGAL